MIKKEIKQLALVINKTCLLIQWLENLWPGQVNPITISFQWESTNIFNSQIQRAQQKYED